MISFWRCNKWPAISKSTVRLRMKCKDYAEAKLNLVLITNSFQSFSASLNVKVRTAMQSQPFLMDIDVQMCKYTQSSSDQDHKLREWIIPILIHVKHCMCFELVQVGNCVKTQDNESYFLVSRRHNSLFMFIWAESWELILLGLVE